MDIGNDGYCTYTMDIVHIRRILYMMDIVYDGYCLRWILYTMDIAYDGYYIRWIVYKMDIVYD